MLRSDVTDAANRAVDYWSGVGGITGTVMGTAAMTMTDHHIDGTVVGLASGGTLAGLRAILFRGSWRMAGVRSVGAKGEVAVRALHDIGPKGAFRAASGKLRKPDGMNDVLSTLSEVKNVARQGWSRQLRDYSAHAQANGYTFNLYVNTSTQLSSRLLTAQQQGLVNVIRVRM